MSILEGTLLEAFLHDPGMVSSIVPTSQKNIQRICSNIPSDKDVTIVEYGAGTGVFAEHLLQEARLTHDSILILIELNEKLAAYLAKKFDGVPRVHVVQGSAADVKNIMKSCNVDGVDHVISSIPFSRMAPKEREFILEETKDVMNPGAHVTVFQMRKAVLNQMARVFGHVQKAFAWKNLPPLWIFRATIQS